MDNVDNVFSENDYGVLIDRFQPFTSKHMALIQRAMRNGMTRFKLLVCASNSPRSLRNPFSYCERVQMISRSLRGLSKSSSNDVYTPPYPSTENHISFSVYIDNQAYWFTICPIPDNGYSAIRWRADCLAALNWDVGSDRHTYITLDEDAWNDNYPSKMCVYPQGEMDSELQAYCKITSESILRLYFNENIIRNEYLYMDSIKGGLRMVPKETAEIMIQLRKCSEAFWLQMRHTMDLKLANEAASIANDIAGATEVLVILQVEDQLLLIKKEPEHELEKIVGTNILQFPAEKVRVNESLEDAVVRSIIGYTDINPKAIWAYTAELAAIRANIVVTRLIDKLCHSFDRNRIVLAAHVVLPQNITIIDSPTRTDIEMVDIDDFFDAKLMQARMAYDHYEIAKLIL